jgi:hypothetical protein
MKVKLGKAYQGSRVREGQIVDLPEAMAKEGIKKGILISLEEKKESPKRKRKSSKSKK